MSGQNVKISKERLKNLREKREDLRKEAYRDALPIIGKEAVDEMKDLMSLFDERIYIWLAGLYDKETGAFYYSESGRDTEGYLPDLESTVQALSYLETTGLCGRGGHYKDMMSDKMKANLLKFTNSLHDPEDGYFYHPQWGKYIATSRRGRDLSWGVEIYKEFGVSPKYPTAYDRLSNDSKGNDVPEHLRSIENFKEYLTSLDITNNSYVVGNTLQSQVRQIIAAGEEYTKLLFFWLEEHQKYNGLWQDDVGFSSVNGLMKFMLMYTAAGACLPNPLAALKSAIDVATNKELPISFCCQFYNPLVAINSIILNIYKNAGREKSDVLRAELIARAPEIIKETKRRILTCRKEDGSYSYTPWRTSHVSQEAPVATMDTNEGDVNATCITSGGCVRNLCQMFAIPTIPFFTNEDGELFFELVAKRRKNKKLYPKPDYFDSQLKK